MKTNDVKSLVEFNKQLLGISMSSDYKKTPEKKSLMETLRQFASKARA